MAEEALHLLTAALLGLCSGLLYDIIRPWRFTSGRIGAAAADIIFCLFTGGMQFAYAMHMPGGRANIWSLGLSLAGFAAYLQLLSPFILPVLDKAKGKLVIIDIKYKNYFKKRRNSAKNLFKK